MPVGRLTRSFARQSATIAAVWILISLLLLVAPITSYGQDNGPVQIGRINTDGHPQIEIVVSALDANGKPQLGLTASDFSVYEDDKPIALQSAASITDANIPLVTVLVIDTSFSMRGQPLQSAKAAAIQYVDQVRDIDQLALVTFNSTVTEVQTPTQDKALIKQKINALTAHDQTALYDGIAQAVKTAQSASVPRRAIVLLTDGSEYGGLSKTGREDAYKLADKAGIPIYTIGLGFNTGVDETYLKAAAQNTGGQYYRSPKPEDLSAVYTNIGQLLRSLYVLTIQTKLPADGTTHRLKVALNANPSAPAERSARYPAPIPVITFSGIDPNKPIAQLATVTPHITADNTLTGFEYKIDGKSVQLGAGAATALSLDPVKLTPGKHTLTLAQTDNKGHIGTASLDFQVAALPPVFKIDGLTDGETLDADRTATLTVIQSQTPPGTATFDIDGTALSSVQQAPYNATIQILSLEPGPHQLNVQLQNQGGSSKQSVKFVVAEGPRQTVTAIAGETSTAIVAASNTAVAVTTNTAVAAASNTAVAGATNTQVAGVTNTAVVVQITAFAGETLTAQPTITPLPSDTEPASVTPIPPTDVPPTQTELPTDTPLPTVTPSPLPTATYTDTPIPPTATSTPTFTPSKTSTPTVTPTFTPSNTSTPTITPTFTPSPTPTPVPALNRVINFVTTPVGTLCAGALIVLILIALMILSGGRNRNPRNRINPPPR